MLDAIPTRKRSLTEPIVNIFSPFKKKYVNNGKFKERLHTYNGASSVTKMIVNDIGTSDSFARKYNFDN